METMTDTMENLVKGMEIMNNTVTSLETRITVLEQKDKE